MILTKNEILSLIKNTPPLIEGYIDLAKQLQPAGFDLTLRSVHIFGSGGAIDFDNTRRVIPQWKELPFGRDGSVFLDPGAYVVSFNEIVNMPLNLIAIAKPRSSLLRSGATVSTAVWDPGYRGRSKALLVIYNPHGLTLYRNARIVQLIFIKLIGEVLEGYAGVYQGET